MNKNSGTISRPGGTFLFLAICCWALVAGPGAFGAQTGKGDRDAAPKIVLAGGKPALILPARLKDLIKTELPGFHLPARKDMVKAWAAYAKKDSLPYVCWGDFNGDGRTDVILILIGKDDWRLFAFHQTAEGGYHFLEPDGFPGPAGAFPKNNAAQEFYIYTVKAGEELKAGGTALIDYKAKLDTFGFFFLKNKESGLLFEWAESPESEDKKIRKHGYYGASGFNDMTD